jgi:hypothetical protein
MHSCIYLSSLDNNDYGIVAKFYSMREAGNTWINNYEWIQVGFIPKTWTQDEWLWHEMEDNGLDD